jgi:hypothetical protein
MIGATWLGRASVVGVAFVVAALLYAVFPVLAHVIGMAGHEAGHAVSGWLLGVPSFPVPYLTIHWTFSWTVQVVVLVALAATGLAAGRTRPWVVLPALALTAALGVLAALGLSAPVSAYMGNGGAVLIGSGLVFASWTASGADRGFVAFAGFSMVFDAVGICAKLATDEPFRTAYSKPGANGFGIDNDFLVLANQFPDLTVERLAWGTVALGVASLVLANVGGLLVALSSGDAAR